MMAAMDADTSSSTSVRPRLSHDDVETGGGNASRLFTRPSKRTYDGFISYSTDADGEFAPKIQDGLEKLTKRWYQLRALTIFQDVDDLPASDNLPQALLEALDASTTLVFLASPGAASSKWCNAELQYWTASKSKRPFVIILTDGTLAFDRAVDGQLRTATPPAFLQLGAEPVYIDMTDERQRFENLDAAGRRAFGFESDSEFRAKLTKVAAAVHTNKNPLKPVGPRDIDSDDKRAFDTARRLRNVVAVVLVALTVAAVIAAAVAAVQRREAQQGRRVALSKQLASQSIESSDEQLDLGSLLAIEAYRTERTPDAFGSWVTAAARSGDVALMLHGHERPLARYQLQPRWIADGVGRARRHGPSLGRCEPRAAWSAAASKLCRCCEPSLVARRRLQPDRVGDRCSRF